MVSGLLIALAAVVGVWVLVWDYRTSPMHPALERDIDETIDEILS
jgi:hypothetical protein